MKHLTLLLSIAFLAVSCTEKEDATLDPSWAPENASTARHITTVHGFVISPAEESHLRVGTGDKNVTATFRDDVLVKLGGEKAIFVLGWEQNPQELSRHEYLYFLEALHAYLVLNAPEWDGGEG